jgi:uncharacterized Zn-finger protein
VIARGRDAPWGTSGLQLPYSLLFAFPMATPTPTIPANAETRYTVSRADLPLSCPMPAMTLWNSHPRVYLPIEASGEAKCPYCGAVFTLKD